MSRKALALEWEGRWAVPAGVLCFASVVFIVAAGIVGSSVSGDGTAEVLRSVEDHTSAVTGAGILQGLAYLCWLLPLLYLFRAAAARTDSMQRGLIGAIIVAPILFGAYFIVSSAVTIDGAHSFTSQTVQGSMDHMNDVADDAINGASLSPLSTGLELAGRLGLAFSMAYTCLFAMRLGLLTRFWGSAGMAVGVAVVVLSQFFALLWFLYLGFLLLGWVRGGRPPAWAAGEAIPWPSPGERLAAEMDPSGRPGDVEGEGSEVTPDDDGSDERTLSDPNPTSARELGEIGKKRKRRGR